MKKCGRCSKPAVLHITEIREGDVQALHLCEGCAKEYLSTSEAGGPATDTAVADAPGSPGESGDSSEVDQQTCPSCGITFKEFRSQGRLGCPHDYIAFQSELLPLLENIHGETQHVGKAAVDEELYEEAARIRDEISQIESNPGGSEK